MPFHITSWCAQLLVHANRLMDHYNCMLPVVLAAPDCPLVLRQSRTWDAAGKLMLEKLTAASCKQWRPAQ